MNQKNKVYMDKLTLGDCRDHLPLLSDNSVELLLSDIPYGISLNDWDVIHANTNSALLGQSPAQFGKSGFKRRGKPINGWSQSDRNIGREYEDWCKSWVQLVMPKLRSGASVFIFGARRTIHRVVNSFEDSGFLLKDILAWKKTSAHHRAQRVSIVFDRRGLKDAAEAWRGWRLGNLAPIYEPIAWFIKPYRIGGTVADNVLEHGVGAINTDGCQKYGTSPTNVLEFGFERTEQRIHEAQKPLQLIELLIELTTREHQTVLDPFMGSGTTALAARRLKRHFIGFEIVPEFYSQSVRRLGQETTSVWGQGQSQDQGMLFDHRNKNTETGLGHELRRP